MLMNVLRRFEVLLGVAVGAGLQCAAAAIPFEGPVAPAPNGRIDEWIFAQVQQRHIGPVTLCSDAVFVRRVYLDVIGTLPTPDELRAFYQNRSPDRRRALIDRLLDREEFADYWALKWGDLLRIKAEFPINLWPNAVQGYHRWVRTCLLENTPYDRFARDLLTASGSNFRVPPVNFYRAVQGRDPAAIAKAVALTFMGARAESWPPDRLAGMAAFFASIGFKSSAEWKEEIVFFDPDAARNTNAATTAPRAVPLFPDGTRPGIGPDQDPRKVFADWLTAPDNPWFARAIVNRIWSWLLGRGLVHEPDDLRPDNPPSHPELLAWLEQELVAHQYDLKHIYRLILNSRTYQLSSVPPQGPPPPEDSFARYPLRRLEAEVLIDALCSITGTTEKYSSAIPEPFTFIPERQRSIALADGSITSPFLEMFGRPPRDTGLESERNNRTTVFQQLHLLNSSHIQRKLEQSRKLRTLLQAGPNPRESLNRLYLTILSRYPTDTEAEAARAYVQSGNTPAREAMLDVAWALINSPEFLYRH